MRRGSRLLVNITNDEWFGKSAGPIQHADLAILRSVELGMGLARAANTGVSMVVDPYGRVQVKTELFVSTVIAGDVMEEIGPTTFARWGDWVTLLSIGLVLALVGVAWFRPIGARHAAAPGGR